MAVTSVQEALNILNGLVSTQKVENEGINDQGKLSSDEWNAVVVVVNSLLKLGGHTNVADAVDSNAALNDQVLYRAAGESEWRIISVDSVPTNGSDNPVASGGVYIRLDAIAQTISELADNIAYVGEDDGEGGVPTGGGSTPVDLTDYALKTWVSQNFLGKTSMDTTPTANSTNPVTSGGVKQYVDSHGGGGSGNEMTVYTLNIYDGTWTDVTIDGVAYKGKLDTTLGGQIVADVTAGKDLRVVDGDGEYFYFSGNALGICSFKSLHSTSGYIVMASPSQATGNYNILFCPGLLNYGKSNTGIPVTDLDSATQAKLAKIEESYVVWKFSYERDTSSETISFYYETNGHKYSDIAPIIAAGKTLIIRMIDNVDGLGIENLQVDMAASSNGYVACEGGFLKTLVFSGATGSYRAYLLSEGSNDTITVTLQTNSSPLSWDDNGNIIKYKTYELATKNDLAITSIAQSAIDTTTETGIYKVTGTAGALLQNSQPYLMLVNEYNVTTMRPTVTTTHYICQTRFQGSLITQRRMADGGTWSEWEDAFEDIKALKSDVRVIPVDSSSYGDLDAIDNIMEDEVPLTGLFYVTIQHVDSIETILVNQHWNEDVGVRQVAYTKDGIKKRFWDEETRVWGEWEWVRGDTNVIETVKVNGNTLTPDANKAVDITVPTALADLNTDNTHQVVTNAEKTRWNAATKGLEKIAEADIDNAITAGIYEVNESAAPGVPYLLMVEMRSSTETIEDPISGEVIAGPMQLYHFQTRLRNNVISRRQSVNLGSWSAWEDVTDNTKADKVTSATANNAAALDANGNLKDSGVPAAGIPFGRVDSTSTATAFTATVHGITELRDGICVLLENGVVTSAAGFTLNINNLGAKPSFNNMTAATRDTTIFNVNYTMLFVYDATRVVDGITGAWCCYRGYDGNTNTLGYQIRTNSSTLPVSDQTGRYRLLFTSADGSKYVPATTSTSTNATSSRSVNQRPIDPHGAIVYYSSTTVISANGNVGTSSQWQQYTLTLGYSFNRTGAALVLSYPKPIYVKCTPQTDGSAIIDADTPYVQALPTTADGKIYIHLGRAYSATAIELTLDHPVYHYYNGAIRRWLGPV